MSAMIEARANFDRQLESLLNKLLLKGGLSEALAPRILPLPPLYRLTSLANSLSGSAITFLSPRADERGGGGVMRIGRVGKTNNRREFVLLNTGFEVLPGTNLVG